MNSYGGEGYPSVIPEEKEFAIYTFILFPTVSIFKKNLT